MIKFLKSFLTRFKKDTSKETLYIVEYEIDGALYRQVVLSTSRLEAGSHVKNRTPKAVKITAKEI